ncbi:sensor histidine kinase [Aquimarina algiphila]|nr:ATP-binding protein [Aquimarina algiphila]
MLDNTVEQVRRISHNLAPSSLLNFNLIEVIQQFCDRINSSNPLNTSFQYFGKQFKLEKEKETVIYRIIQELTNNIIKHANATEALIQINSYENKLHITVEDNGIGFDPDVKSHGIGLQNIKSRVSLLNANLDIHSSAEGTSFNIEIYLDKI